MDERPVPRRDDREAIDALLVAVEDRCNRAVAVLRVAARAVEGDELALHEDGVASVFGAALERLAGELEALSGMSRPVRAGAQGQSGWIMIHTR